MVQTMSLVPPKGSELYAIQRIGFCMATSKGHEHRTGWLGKGKTRTKEGKDSAGFPTRTKRTSSLFPWKICCRCPGEKGIPPSQTAMQRRSLSRYH